jgi:hypothetical protein
MFATLLLAGILASGGIPAQPTAAQAAMNAAIAQVAAPADCVKALQTFVSARRQEVRTPADLTAELLKEIDEEKVFLARTCLARFGPSSVKGEHLPALAALYIEAGKPAEGKATMARALAEPMSPGDRAATLTTAINVILREAKGDERNARLETLIDELDASPAATLDQKLAAHSQLLDYYRGDHLDAGIIKHSTWMAATAKTLTPEERRKYGAQIAKLLAEK